MKAKQFYLNDGVPVLIAVGERGNVKIQNPSPLNSGGTWARVGGDDMLESVGNSITLTNEQEIDIYLEKDEKVYASGYTNSPVVVLYHNARK